MRNNIPMELRSLAQWVCANSDKIPINPKSGAYASVTDPSTWCTYDEANSANYLHVGFVLTDQDDFCIIDLDNKPDNPASEDELQRHYKILNAFDSYTERSTSGTGYHIIVRGSIPSGVHRDKVEVYSSGRYMICTGDVVRNSPILDYQEWLTILYNEMAPTKHAELVDRDEVIDDAELIEMAMAATNGDKFNKLCRGEWQGEYPSQSEADFALLSIFTFYTPNNEQVRRLFRMTALGKRDKATKNDVYLNRSMRKIRGSQTPELDFAQLVANAQAIMQQQRNAASTVLSPQIPTPGLLQQPTSAELQLNNITLPPGIIGEIATYFYQTAIRPVYEIALVAALGVVAGIVGRSYNISGSGLNQYLILLAKTGSGKEGAASGIENLISAVRPQIPAADEFIGPAAFASGQALIRVLDQRPCFVSVLGEFGITLQELCDHRANSAQKMLKKVLLDLYAKSGWNRTLRSSVYSDIEKNTKIIQAPNVTILGESTPETFYDGLDVSHIADGLIPRFSVVEYNGPRPALNKNANMPPPAQLLQRFADLIAVAMTTTNNNSCCPVSIDADALIMLDEFERYATDKINHTKLSVEVQLWNRAHLKVLKLAALLAVGINPHAPVVTVPCVEWTIKFVRSEVEGVARRFQIGDVGQGDSKQIHDLKRAVEAYFTLPPNSLVRNEVLMKLQQAKIITYSYLQTRTACLASFKKDRLGPTPALKRVLQIMIDSGSLVEVKADKLQNICNFSGLAYKVGSAWQ